MTIEQIKERFTCFDLLGAPVKRWGESWMYHVPWRTDRDVSLAVSPNGKGWKDWGEDDKGDVVDLIGRLIGTEDKSVICRAADSFSSPQAHSFLKEGGGEKKEKADAYTIRPLYSYPLKNYLQSRGIPVEIARKVVSELRWTTPENPGQTLYTIAYPTDAGGWVTRNLHFKRTFGRGGMTTHLTQESAPWVVFEGFFDLLSWVVLCKGVVKHNFITLNSVSNVRAAIDRLTSVSTRIYLALDNDQAGDQATAQLTAALPTAIDIRDRFAPYNDLNDYLREVYR